jgi:hypothetical protein
MTARALAALVALLLFSQTARATDTSEKRDTAHGRFDGDLAIAPSVGATFGPRGPRVAADARFRYLSTAGLFVTYEDGPLVGSRAEPRRVFATGVELRPLFLARWARGWEIGEPRVDLLIDSLALEIGAAFSGRPGLQAGLGLEIPLFARATGLFIGVHGGARWSDTALSGGPLAGPSDRSLYLALTLGWQQLFGGNVVDLGDPRR